MYIYKDNVSNLPLTDKLMVVKQKNFEMLSDEQKILGMAGV
jgi:hypothetical protein